jgi:hypothetical protein
VSQELMKAEAADRGSTASSTWAALPGAEPLLVPVHRRPSAPPDLLLVAVRRLGAPDTGPFALLPREGTGDGGVDVMVLTS